MNWRVARTVGLWCLIIFTIAMLVILAIYHQWIWFTAFSVIAATILFAEGFSYFFTSEHITISTKYGRFMKTNPVPATAALAFFLIAMLSLCVHLVGYAFK